MGEYFSAEISGFDKLEKSFKEFSNKGLDKSLKKATTVLGGYLYREIKSNTPVKTGELRRSWKIISSGKYSVIIYNTKQYALYVEYGHRQDVGRYIPAIGKRLKNSWVEGRYFVKKSLENFNGMSKKEIEKLLLKEFQKILKKQ